MKIKVKIKSSEIEFEGTQEELGTLLDDFYQRISLQTDNYDDESLNEGSGSGEGITQDPTQKSKRKRKNSGSSQSSAKGAGTPKTRDDLITELSNGIKNSGIAPDIQKLIESGTTLQKMLCLWKLIPTEQQLSAAEMAKMYEKFSIKVKVENIRPTISKNKDLFLDESVDGLTYYRPTLQAMQKIDEDLKA